MPEPEIFDTFADVGKLLKLSPKTIYRIAKTDPTFPVTTIGGTKRAPRSRLLRWLAKQTQGK